MIKSWHVENFKSIQDQTLKLAPLTILCGVNNSGKTSFIQSMELLVKTARSDSKEINLKDDINFRSFDHIYNYKTMKKYKDEYTGDYKYNEMPPISFGFEIENDDNEVISFGFDFSKSGDANIKLENSYIKYTANDNNIYYYDTRSQTKHHDIFDEASKKEIEKKWGDEFSDSSYEVLYIKEALKLDDTALFPEFIKLVDIESVFGKNPEKITIPNTSPKIDISGNLKKTIKYLHDLFSSNINGGPKYKYIGPVSDTIVNQRGSETYKLIREYFGKDITVINYIPLKSYLAADYNDKIEISFEKAFNEWLKHFDIPDIPDLDNLGLTIDINFFLEDDDLDVFSYELSQLGTGVGQILPILTTCLAAEPKSTIIISEPEAHLHPKLQSKLLDFFIAMALSNRQIIIETHSEYFINKICEFYSSKPDKFLKEKDLCKIYFSEKQDGVTEFEPVQLNTFGVIKKWPKDFFDQLQEIKLSIINNAIVKKENMDKEKND